MRRQRAAAPTTGGGWTKQAASAITPLPWAPHALRQLPQPLATQHQRLHQLRPPRLPQEPSPTPTRRGPPPTAGAVCATLDPRPSPRPLCAGDAPSQCQSQGAAAAASRSKRRSRSRSKRARCAHDFALLQRSLSRAPVREGDEDRPGPLLVNPGNLRFCQGRGWRVGFR